MEIQNTKEFAKQWIENGNPCIYRYGYGYRGAGSKHLTKDEAFALLPKYSFGMGFYTLSFFQDRRSIPTGSMNCTATEAFGPVCLEFNELSANDMW